MKLIFRILKWTGILILIIIAALVIIAIRNSKEQEKQQALMVKTDEELIGTHFYVPRGDKEDVDVNLHLLNDGNKHPLVINLHGGAFIAGDADTLDTQSDRISDM